MDEQLALELLELEYPPDLNQQDEHSRTALHWTAKHSLLALASRLAERGADLEVATDDFIQVIMIGELACCGGDLLMCK